MAHPARPQAIRLDEAAEGALTGSMVDDVFFVLLKAGRRAMGTGKAPSVVAILNALNTLLSSTYRAALAAKLQVGAGAGGRGPGAAAIGMVVVARGWKAWRPYLGTPAGSCEAAASTDPSLFLLLHCVRAGRARPAGGGGARGGARPAGGGRRRCCGGVQQR